MNLSGLFQYGKKNSQSQVSQADRSGTVTPSEHSHAAQQMKNLIPGQTIHGEIVSRNGSEVQIRLYRDVVINARLEKELPVTPGQSMTFEVKNSTGAQVALRPLYENLAQDPNVLRALEAARLPATEALTRMVSSMMEQGMSIDKNSVLSMSRLVMSNSPSAPETVVALKNMEFPVTSENIEQLEAYSNYEHQLLGGVKNILSELPEAFQSMINSGQEEAAVKLYMQVLQLFAGAAAGTADGTDESGQTILSAETAQTAEGVLSEGSKASAAEGNAAMAGEWESGNRAEAGGNPLPQEPLKAALKALTDTAEALRDDTAGRPPDAVITDDAFVPPATDQKATADIDRTVLPKNSGADAFGQLLAEIGFSGEKLFLMKDTGTDTAQLLHDIAEVLLQNGKHIDTAVLRDLFASKEFGQLLDSEILRQWLLKPQDVAQKGSVEEFYTKLRAQTERLTQALDQIAKDTPLAKSLTSVQNNIDFMNQLNQLYQYVQLPLKMSGGEAHGDLYVYMNRKGAARTDGSVNAFLHLDMEHLGMVDVYVTMKDNQVSTRFYLKDEHMIDFMGAHISMLSDRLTKRGYSFQSEMLLKEELNAGDTPADVMENLTGKEGRNSPAAICSFDVRA